MISSSLRDASRVVRLGAILLAVIVLSGLLVRWNLVEQLPFIMDEFVDVQLGVQTSRGAQLYRDQPWERTPLMTYLVGAIADSEGDSYSTTIRARRSMWLFALAITLHTMWLARRIAGPISALLAGALLLSFSNFLGTSIQVRSDVMATALVGPALAVAVVATPSRLFLLGAGLALGSAFVTTQKAIYFAIAFGFARLAHAVVSRPGFRVALRRFLVDGFWTVTGFLVPIALTSFAFWRLGALQQLIDQVLVHGSRVGFVAETYSATWIHALETLGRNPAFWLLGISGATAFLLEAAKGPRADGAGCSNPELAGLGAWTAALLMLYAQHTSKFPYVFINPAPALAICGAVLLMRYAKEAFAAPSGSYWRSSTWILAVFSAVILWPAYHLLRTPGPELLRFQRSIMDRVDDITTPDDAVFDGIGIAVTRRKATPWSMTARWYDERRAGADYDLAEYLRARGPKVMIWNYRLASLPSAELELIRRSFVHDGSNVFVAGTSVKVGGDSPEVAIDLLSSAIYALEAEAPDALFVDGAPASPQMTLRAGQHVLRAGGAKQSVTVRLASAADKRRHPPLPPKDLFLNYSSW